MIDSVPDPEQLVHLCEQQRWDEAQSAGELIPESLRDAGFIHLSTRRQVHLPANRLFAGRLDIVMLLLNHAVLTAPLRWEPGVPGDPESMLFPHLYGVLPITAVAAVRPYRPGSDGRFPPFIHSPGE